MHRMGQPVERRPVQSAVNPLKIEAVPDWDKKKDRYKPDRVLRPSGKHQITVGKAPSHQHLINRPSQYAAGTAPEHSVEQLPLSVNISL